ncbi:hypothetical protein GF318_03535 [Candidatus Micrarchaeota archaeon]|nr:hypothetical protein [Candidatus Micrarchaeota archaeon]
MTVKELDELLKNMRPSLDRGRHYMISVDEKSSTQFAGYLSRIICLYREDEGLTVVFPEE